MVAEAGAKDATAMRTALERLESRDAQRHESDTALALVVRVGLRRGTSPTEGNRFTFTIRNDSHFPIQIEQFRMIGADGAPVQAWSIDFPDLHAPKIVGPRSTLLMRAGQPSQAIRTCTARVKLATTELLQIEHELDEAAKEWLRDNQA